MATSNVVVPLKPQAVSTSTSTALATGTIRSYNASAGALAPVLPSLANVVDDDYLIVEKDSLDATLNAVTVTCAGSDTTANGSTSIALTVKGQRVELQAATISGTRVWKTVHHTIPKDGLDALYKQGVATIAAAPATQALAANTTYDITGVAGQTTTFTPPAPALGAQITLVLRQPSSGSVAPWTFPNTIHWPNGQLPVFSLLSGAEDQVTLFGMANGSWLGIFGATNASIITPPNAPINVYAAAKPGAVTLQWLATSPGGAPLSNYAILRSTTSGTQTQIGTASASSTSFTDSTVTNGTTYYYKVAAVTSVGSANSSEVSATPKATVAYPDATSNARPLTVSGTVYSVPSPLSGASSAVQGDGTTGYLNAGNIQTGLGIGGTNPWTIEGWMKKTRTGVGETPIGAYTATGARQLALLSNSSNNIQAFVWNSGGASLAVASSGTITDTANPHHFAIIWDGTSLYVALDGTVTKASGTLSGGVNSSYTGNLLFGADNNGSGNVPASFSSAIFDELRVSSTARYTANFTVPTAPLTADANTTGLWHLDGQA